MPFPSDIPNSTWNPDNLQKWSDPQVTTIGSVQLQPLEAKALHIIGTLVQIFDSVGYGEPQSQDHKMMKIRYIF